jgi:quercetin dioxygenase-like cupin family protein
MNINKAGTVATRRAPAEYFTGTVFQDPVNTAPSPARVSIARVTFTPGARTAWHTHPLGQTLYVLSGCGRVQIEGEPVREICAGDVVWILPGEKHWHGAAPTTMMCHLAVQEQVDGSAATWLEHVTDAQYEVAPQK